MTNDRYASEILSRIALPEFQRATFGGTARGAKTAIERVVVRPVVLRGERFLQVSSFDGRKDLSRNVAAGELAAGLAEVLAAGYSNVHIRLAVEEVDIRLTKKGEVLIGTVKKSSRETADSTHNRVKNLPLPEGLNDGAADKLLTAMGIVDRHGNVKPTMRDKFTQINEFLKLLEHVLPDVQKGESGPLTILDCGCGASHLTLATAHFLNEVKKMPARVVGVDVNEEVIAKSRARGAELGCDYLEFRAGKIGSLENVKADIVLALHACDTATDDALAQGIKSGAQLIMAVPCCHKDLNAHLKVTGLEAIHRHGILHERLADIVTDTFRALLLKVMGYRAEVIEFISPEHTARNVMIRAVKVRPAGDKAAMREYEVFKEAVGATPYLEKAITSLLPASK